MTPEEFRRRGHQLIDWIADYRVSLEARPVMARTMPGEVKAQLPEAPPEAPESFDAILRDLEAIVVPGLTHFAHPRFFGYFPSNGDLSSVLGDFASTGLAALGITWQAGPALTEVEEVVTDWLRSATGLDPAFKGVIQDTASTSTLTALICARERASQFSFAGGGIQSLDAPLVVYMSAEAHSSVEKAAVLAGFGRENLRVIRTDDRFAMRADDLARAVETDVSAGRVPCAIVATVGSTTTTAVDPIKEIAAVARTKSVWLHVDAAMAGSAMILSECRGLWEGIDEADSLVTNPHKWLGAAFDCSVYYVRSPEDLMRVMSANASYLQRTSEAAVANYRDWGIPLGRRFRALKLWFLLREQGLGKLRERLRRDLENAQWLAAQVAATPHWRVLNPVVLQTVCVRHEPPGLAGEALDRHTLGWCEAINRSGFAFLTPALLDGRWMVRVSIGAIATEREHVQQLWAEFERVVQKDIMRQES